MRAIASAGPHWSQTRTRPEVHANNGGRLSCLPNKTVADGATVTARPDDAALRVARVPRFHPRAHALLKVAHNLIRDSLINIGPHWRPSLLGLRVQPARPAPRSGGWPSRPKNVGWCGPERFLSATTRPAFLPVRLGHDGLGAAGPRLSVRKVKVIVPEHSFEYFHLHKDRQIATNRAPRPALALVSAVFEASEVGAKHIGHGPGVGFDLCGGSRGFRELLADRAERRCDQVARQCTRRF
jgi:hypothetical protein